MSGNQTESTMKYKLDISDLKANMQEARRTMSLANSEFKASVATMGDWSKSTDGLSAKLKQLDTVMGSQKNVLKSLEDQYVKISEEQGVNSKAAQDLEIKINNQKAAIGKTENQIKTYTQKLDDIEQSSGEAESAMGKLNTEIQNQENKLSALKNEYQKTVLEKGKDSDETRRLANEIDSLNADLEENKSRMKESAYAADDLSQELDEAGKSAGNTEGGFTIMKGALAGLLAEGIKLVVGGLKDMVTESDRASKHFQASTGANAESMSMYNKEMQDMYKNNYGESLDDIAESMREVKNQTNGIDSGPLAEMTKNAITLRDTFGFEVKESMRAVNMLVEQFGMKSDEAFNLVVQGAQRGLDKNGDLLDTINEYAPYYKRMGASGEEFFNSLMNGAKSGTFSVDKLGDAYKEFNIRVQDTANTTTEGFKMLGLNADTMRSKFAQGGESAKNATDEVLIAFNKIDDPVKRNQIGVDLWGTMFEDLGEKGVLALMDLSGSASKTSDKMESIKNIKYDDIGNQFTELGRTIKVDVLIPFAQKLIPALKDGINWTKNNLDTIIPIAKNTAIALAGAFAVKGIFAFKEGIASVGASLLELGSKNIPLVSGAASKLGVFLSSNPWLVLAGAVAGVGLSIYALTQTEDEHTKKMKEENEQAKENTKAWEDLQESKKKAIDQAVSEIDHTKRLKNELSSLVDENGKVKDGYEDRVNFIVGKLNDAYGTEISIVDGTITKYKEQMETIDKLIEKKRAAAIIEAGSTAYTEALNNETKAWNEVKIAQDAYEKKMQEWKVIEDDLRRWGMQEDDIATEKMLFNRKNDVDTLKSTYDEKSILAQGYTDTIAEQEFLQKLYAQGNAEDIAAINAYVATSYDDKGKKVVLTTQQQIDNESSLLEYIQKKYAETGDQIYLDQIRASEERLKTLNANIDNQKTTINMRAPEVSNEWKMLSDMGLNAYGGNDPRFRDAAIRQTINAQDGIDEGSEYTNSAWRYLSEQGLAEYKSNHWQYTPAGKDAVEGIEIGIGKKEGNLFTKMFNLGLGMISNLRLSIDSHSPSKKAMLIGQDWNDGLVVGLEKSMPEVMDAIELPIDGLKKAASDINIRRSPAVSTGVIPNAASGSVVNYFQTNNSPKPLNSLEIYRKTNTLLFSTKVRMKK